MSRQFKVDNLKSNLVRRHSYIHVIFNFFELSTLNCLDFEWSQNRSVDCDADAATTTLLSGCRGQSTQLPQPTIEWPEDEAR